MSSEPEPEPDAWIEKVVKITSALGMNPTRTRWKLIRWQEKRRKAARRREQTALHVGYKHKTCDECGAVQDREATECSRCGARLGSHAIQVARRIGLVPRAVSVSMVLAFVCLAVYVRVLIAAGGGLGSPSAVLIYDFGGHWPPAIADEPWRWLTAVFLHFGLWHVGFNLLAIAAIGPRVEELYGRLSMLFLLVATGVLANIGSGLTGLDGVGAGASGGVMGLIGVAAGHGHRLGRPGHALRNDMLRWSAFTILIGFFIGADNRAHIFGGLVGAAFGYLVAPRSWNAPRWKPLRLALGAIGVAATIAALAIIFTRTPGDDREPDTSPRVAGGTYEPYAELCRKQLAGVTAGARAEFDRMAPSLGGYVSERSGSGHTYRHSTSAVELYGDEDPVVKLCESFLVMRAWCRSGAASKLDIPNQQMTENCELVEKAFGAFTEQPTSRVP